MEKTGHPICLCQRCQHDPAPKQLFYGLSSATQVQLLTASLRLPRVRRQSCTRKRPTCRESDDVATAAPLVDVLDSVVRFMENSSIQ